MPVLLWLGNQSALVYWSIATAIFALWIQSAVASDDKPVLALDFGPKDSPVAEGFAQVTRATAYDAKLGYGWIKPPPGEFDRPLAYPLDPLSRDGVIFSTSHPIELRLDLPNGDYLLEMLMGDCSPTEFRPGMFVAVNGRKIISGLVGTAGTPVPVRMEATVADGRVLLTFGNRHPILPETESGGSLNWLIVRKRSNPALQLRRSDPQDLRPAVRWLATDKLRLVFGMDEQYVYDPSPKDFVNVSEQLWDRAAKLGFNAVTAPLGSDCARYFHKRGLRLFHVINYATGENYAFAEREFVKNVHADGREDIKPSPLDHNAWQDLVVKETLRVHRLSAESQAGLAVAEKLPLTGVLIDLEMYGAKIAEVYSNSCTFDAPTFDEFVKLHPEVGTSAAVPPDKRQAALADKKLLQVYYAFMEKKMETIAREVEQQIHKEAPDLLIGFLQYFDNWFFRGFIRGLGAPSMPVLVFSENTYYGYNYHAAFEYAWWQKEGMHAFYYPGFWPKYFHPDNIGPQVYGAAIESDGYWLYGYVQTDERETPAMDASLAQANKKFIEASAAGSVDRTYAVVDHAKYPAAIEKGSATTPAIPDPDPHETKLAALPSFENAVHKFDFGQPKSPVQAGWSRVLSTTLFDEKPGYGWARPPYHSFDRADHCQDALLQDGIVARGRNEFLARVQPGRYEVTIILGDMSPREPRPRQNVRVNGKPLAANVTTNGGEYRLFSGVFESDKLLRIEFEGRGGQYVSVLGIAICPVASTEK
ncbi:MAG: hypothetical protein HY360_21810 [Verrucomicrobia bacterium]|nr:hypothetical protein [Verrucomicrobiota bacterium]